MNTRLASLDALRGLDMLIIIGLDALVHGIAALNPESPFWYEMWLQFGHVAWEGLPAYDLVFPIFLFIAGVSMSLSFAKTGEDGKGKRILRLWYRAAWLVFFGWLVNGALTWELSTMRFASVLGLIGISGALAGTFCLLVRNWKAQLIFAVLLLAGVWTAQYLGGDMTPACCLNAKIDQAWCPGKLHSGTFDPEGPLCLVSGAALAVFGILAGRLLQWVDTAPRLLTLVFGGAALVAAGCFAGPIIKGIWTPSFVLISAGTGFLLLAPFHLVCDVFALRAWALPLRVIGMNALFIYLATHIIPFRELTERIFCGTLQACLPQEYYQVGLSSAVIILAWLLCFYMYRHKLFIKI